jgi:hypothetical protein
MPSAARFSFERTSRGAHPASVRHVDVAALELLGRF